MSFNPKNPATLDLLLRRRSEKSKRMIGPGPSDTELRDILSAAMRVPDHGKLAPWRFLVFQGAAQNKLSLCMAESYIAEGGEENSTKHESLKTFAAQAPTMVVVVASPVAHDTIPDWEQYLSAGAACQNMLIAAHAIGYVGQWLTGVSAYSEGVRAFLHLDPHEKIAGFMFFGSSDGDLTERPRPDYDDIVSHWPAD